jgi:hypothetical protein
MDAAPPRSLDAGFSAALALDLAGPLLYDAAQFQSSGFHKPLDNSLVTNHSWKPSRMFP